MAKNNSIFDEIVREKKAEAFLNKARTGSRGGSKGRKGVRTPYDSMTRLEKKRLNGEVASFNMNSLMNYKDFEVKDEDTQKMLLTQWRTLYKNTEIMDAFYDSGNGKRFNTQSFADLVNRLGVPPKQKGGSLPRKPRTAKTKSAAESELSTIQSSLDLEVKKEEPLKLITNGLHLEYNGEYDSEALSKIFTKLQLLIDGEENKFVLAISLSERL
jgi:hypothetical protein